MRILSAAALVAVAIMTAGCSGCSTITAATSGHGVLSGQKMDEQVMGGVDALGSAANALIEAAAKLRDPATGKPVASREQLLLAQSIRKDMDAAHAAAKAAYDAGDAASFQDKLAAINELSRRATALYHEVTK